jgi:hypothetical protein
MGYAWNRNDAPLGNETSSDQLCTAPAVGVDEANSTNLPEGTERSRRCQRWKLLSGTPSRSQNCRTPKPLESNRRRISVHCCSLRRTPLVRFLGIASSSPSALQRQTIRRAAFLTRGHRHGEERRFLTAYEDIAMGKNADS